MKTISLMMAASAVFLLCGCADSGGDRPIPGTPGATSTKDNANINNTPRNNPTPNPDPDSRPPDSVTQQTVIQQ